MRTAEPQQRRETLPVSIHERAFVSDPTACEWLCIGRTKLHELLKEGKLRRPARRAGSIGTVTTDSIRKYERELLGGGEQPKPKVRRTRTTKDASFDAIKPVE